MIERLRHSPLLLVQLILLACFLVSPVTVSATQLDYQLDHQIALADAQAKSLAIEDNFLDYKRSALGCCAGDEDLEGSDASLNNGGNLLVLNDVGFTFGGGGHVSVNGHNGIGTDTNVLGSTGSSVGNSPWTQVSSDSRAVVRDVEANTGIAIPQNQRNQLADQIREVDHRTPVSEGEYAALQREYRRNRTQMIRDWEENTGQVWPEGAQLHHVIPQRYGGPNQWWNAHPALPGQHQGGIHGTGSPTQSVFPTPVHRQ